MNWSKIAGPIITLFITLYCAWAAYFEYTHSAYGLFGLMCFCTAVDLCMTIDIYRRTE